MSKTVSKLIWNSLWDMERKESWLSDMALKGYQLTEIKGFFATFSKNKPKRMEYRIAYFPSPLDSDTLNAYKAKGWTLSANRDFFYIFSNTKQNPCPFPHDSQLDKQRDAALAKSKRTNLLLAFAALFLFLFVLLRDFLFNPIAAVSFLFDNSLSLIRNSLLALALLVQALRNYSIISKSAQHILQNQPLNHHQKWKGAHVFDCILSVILVCVVLLSFIGPVIPNMLMRKITVLPQNPSQTAMVLLSEIEDSPQLERKEGTISDNVDWGNYLSNNWGLWLSAYRESHETATINGKLWETRALPYCPTLDCLYLDTVPDFLLPHVLADLEKIAAKQPINKRILRTLPQALQNSDAPDTKIAVVHADSRILVVNYCGELSQELLTQQVQKSFTEKSKP